MADSPRILIACGGTGGHLFPGVAVARALGARGVRSLLVISEKAIDKRAVDGHTDLEFLALPGKPLAMPWSPRFPAFVSATLRARRLCRRVFRERGVAAVMGMGGFTSIIPAWTARGMGKPVFLHESNAIPGKANRLASRFAKRVFLTLEAAEPYFSRVPCELVGTPVRPSLLTPPPTAEARVKFGLDPERPTLLVSGGSQGARALNDTAVAALAELPPGSCQALIITGPDDEARIRAQVTEQLPGHKAVVVGFCDDMPAAYATASIAVSRAGASTLAELSVCGVPALLVPYPHAADDHQTANARAYEEKGAALIVPESDLTPKHLAERLRQWWKTPDSLSKMRTCMQELALPNAAESMADRVLSFLP